VEKWKVGKRVGRGYRGSAIGGEGKKERKKREGKV